jgi:hypothetical protein
MRHALALIVSMAAASIAHSQPVTAPVDEVTVVATGRLQVDIDGSPVEHEFTATYYPVDYGADEGDGAVGDTMRRLAGRSLHEATWSEQVMEMAGVRYVLSPNLRVELAVDTAYADVNYLGRFSIVLPLQPGTLAIDPSERAVVTYWPPQETGFEVADYFESSSDGGDLVVEIEEAVWENVLGFRLRGRFTGTASAGPRAEGVEGQVRLSGTFVVEWVDGGGAEIDIPLEMMLDGAGS